MLAVTVKESANPEILLEEPEEVIDKPMPHPETPGENENAQAVTDREARDRLRRDKVILEKQERRERGHKVGNNKFYNEVQKRLTSRFFLALGIEGEKNSCKKIHILLREKTRTTGDPIGINSKRNGMITKTQKPELKKACTRCGRKISETHLKSCPAMRKRCKSCSK